MILRPYQCATVERCRSLVNSGKRRIVFVAPCGAGKGTMLAHILASTVRKGNRGLVLTHRRELVEDLAERVGRELGFAPGVILSGVSEDPANPVQVASVQTLQRRTKPVAQTVLVDECHHATAEGWRGILECYPESVVLGSTASPCRLSGAPLGDLFEELVEVVKPQQLVEEGHLVPTTGFAYDAPDLRGVRRSAGDYDSSELAALMGSQRIRGSVVGQYLERSPGTRAIVFAVNVDHSRTLAEQFVRAGVPAEHLDGETHRVIRRAIFERYRTGQTRVLCNVGLFTEGVDLPAIETVILARPTLSLALAIQMIGRGRRPLVCQCGRIPHWRSAACECGRPVLKRFARIHDHAGVLFQHGLPDEPRVWSLKSDFRVGVGEKGKSEASAALRTCRKCFAIYLADQDVCPMCGYRNPAKKRVIRNAQGVAVSLDDLERKAKPIVASESQERKYFFYLLHLERQNSYRPKYAEVRFMGRYKHWPTLAKTWRAEFEQGAKA